ncbi:MAG: class I SAM-dependent methyltransferase, partial [Caldilinea sp.]|nr:class I SAM-dependent methyltransferase [Caldilinea sp.]
MSSQATAPQTKYPDLDYRFLEYLGVSIDGEAALHSIYVPMFAGRDRVVDLGCGLGGFVKLLRAQGIDAFGVDGDPMCVAEARSHDIPVVQDDVLGYLRAVEPESLDGVFSAHLVEHLPYEVVLELIELSFRALRPGGRLLLATPNPR